MSWPAGWLLCPVSGNHTLGCPEQAPSCTALPTINATPPSTPPQPQFVSGASMRAPEEVFASEAGGAPRAEEELEREDRKRRRAQVSVGGVVAGRCIEW